ncbi:MAG: hypothetical protein M3R45_13255 [Pseudomonadota bacterium]|nr:hypothetical protein [Pseudomonadota bacterium]
MKRLDGKRVLLIAPRFFGYEREIRSEIERRGAVVDWLADRPFDTPLMTALTRHRPQWVLPSATRLYQRQLSQMGATHYDTILVVNGQTLSRQMLGSLRTSFPAARVVLYMWDSIDNRRGAVENLPLFDTTFSFDPLSARSHGMRLRPLFFSKGFERAPSDDFDYHLSFVGTAHTDRYAVVSRLRRSLPAELRAYWYLYLQAPWVYQAYRLTNPDMRQARREEFEFQPLGKSVVQSVFSRSLAIVDIEHPRQRGLTMRTFETMGSHKKLVTTNAQVRDYDFFNDSNICVIDRADPRVTVGFLNSPFSPVAPELYRRYSIEGWVDEVLELDDTHDTAGDTAVSAPALAMQGVPR